MNRCYNCDEGPAHVVYESSTAELAGLPPSITLCGWCASRYPAVYGSYTKRGPKPRPTVPPAHGGYPGAVVVNA